MWDENGQEYLDLYGGHAVISIGHAHPHYVEAVSRQVATLGFYSNSVINRLQTAVPRLMRTRSSWHRSIPAAAECSHSRKHSTAVHHWLSR